MNTPLALRFAEWGSALTVAEVPFAVRAQAQRAIFDLLAVILAGSVHPMVRSTRAALAGPFGVCTVVGGRPSTASAAALVNGTAAHVWDFDDTSYTGIMHGSAVVLPAILAAVEESDIGDEDFLAAFIVGSEVAYTLAEVVSHGHYFKGWWSTATLGLIGATAGVARSYRLGAVATTHAIAMAAAGAGATKCIFGTVSKAFFVGETARRAVDFAKAAAAGLTGPVNVFEDPRGFFALLNDGQSRVNTAGTLGSRWRLQDPGLLFKLSPVCSAAQATIEAISQLMRRNEFTVSQIARIHCKVPELVKISLVFDRPDSPQEAQFSLTYTAACAMLHGRVRLEDLEPAEVTSSLKRSIMAKVGHEAAPELSSEQMRSHYPESARISLTLLSGETLEEFCSEAYGMPGRPLTPDSLWKKFEVCAAFASITADELVVAYQLLAADTKGYVPVLSIVRSILKKTEHQ